MLAVMGSVSLTFKIAWCCNEGVEWVCWFSNAVQSAGRQDAAAADPGGRLPAESLSATDLKAAFADKGLDTHDLVVLSGAHTVCAHTLSCFDPSRIQMFLQRMPCCFLASDRSAVLTSYLA